jgi:hypothetical protein
VASHRSPNATIAATRRATFRPLLYDCFHEIHNGKTHRAARNPVKGLGEL